MTIEISVPEAYTAFKAEALKNDSVKDEQCWHVVGDPLDKPIRERVPDYYDKLELGDRRIAMTKRGEILDLFWGRIEQDAAALQGLNVALVNLSTMITNNVTAVRDQWSGESYDAFAVAMGKVATTLNTYATNVGKVAEILAEAMAQARTMYGEFAQYTLQELAFKGISPAEHWHKMDFQTAMDAAAACSCGGGGFVCEKLHNEGVTKIKGKFATTRQLEAFRHEPCWDNLQHVLNLYDKLVRDGEEGRASIRSRVEEWGGQTDQLKQNLREMLRVAIGNLYKLGRSGTFASLHVMGGGQPSGGDAGYPSGGDAGYPSGGYPSGGDAGYPSGGDSSGDAATAAPIVDPTAAAADPSAAVRPEAPAAQPEAPAAQPEPPAAEDPGTVTISDGEHTIGVSNPGVEGHVTITVTGADGVTKTYDLDFDAASGLGPRTTGEQPASPDGVEQIAARSNGQCVIQNGDVTITAERPLFAPDQVTITIDDGAGGVSRHTIDFPAPQDPATATEPVRSVDQRQAPEGETVPPGERGAQPATEKATQTSQPDASAHQADEPEDVDEQPETAAEPTTDGPGRGSAAAVGQPAEPTVDGAGRVEGAVAAPSAEVVEPGVGGSGRAEGPGAVAGPSAEVLEPAVGPEPEVAESADPSVAVPDAAADEPGQAEPHAAGEGDGQDEVADVTDSADGESGRIEEAESAEADERSAASVDGDADVVEPVDGESDRVADSAVEEPGAEQTATAEPVAGVVDQADAVAEPKAADQVGEAEESGRLAAGDEAGQVEESVAPEAGELPAESDESGSAGEPTDLAGQADEARPSDEVGAAEAAATVPQAWAEDARGSVSGVLEPESDGEAGLAVAPDAAAPVAPDAAGMAGAGMPVAGAGPSGTQDNGRAGSGWSVHGDLFDSGEPVYSMHGVLGDEDTDRSDR